MSMISAAVNYANSWIFLPDAPAAAAVVAGPHDFVAVPNPPADYQNEECVICTQPLFNTPIDANYPNVHQTVIAHRPRGRGINLPLCCHIHLECLEPALRRKEECPSCRTRVSQAVVRAIPRNQIPVNPPPQQSWFPHVSRRTIQRLLEEAKELGEKTAIATAISSGMCIVAATIVRIGSLLFPATPMPLSALIPCPLGAVLTTVVMHTIFKGGYSLLIENRRLTRTARIVIMIALTAFAALAVIKLTTVLSSALVTSYLSYYLPPAQIPLAISSLGLTWKAMTALGTPQNVQIIATAAFASKFIFFEMAGGAAAMRVLAGFALTVDDENMEF